MLWKASFRFFTERFIDYLFVAVIYSINLPRCKNRLLAKLEKNYNTHNPEEKDSFTTETWIAVNLWPPLPQSIAHDSCILYLYF